MLLCEHCIDYLRSRGAIVGQFDLFCTIDECEEMETTCEWCNEDNDLYYCEIHDDDYWFD